MAPLWIIGLCFLAGIVLRRLALLPEDGARSLSGYVIYVALPALVLLHVHDLQFRSALAFSALMPHGVFALAFLFFRILGKRKGWSKETILCLTLTAGLGNTSFVGLPMIQAFFGPQYLGIGVIIDQAGSFLALSTWGFALLGYAGEGRPESQPGQAPFAGEDPVDSAEKDSSARPSRPAGPGTLARIAKFPPFQALMLALFLRPLDFPEEFREVLGSIGSSLTPVAMVAVGFQLRLSGLKHRILPLGAGLLFRLALAPVAILTLAAFFFRQPGGLLPMSMQVTVFEAAMPPMITAGILAIDHGKDPELAALMLGVGIPLSFLTLPAVHWILQSGWL
ncbi:MAG: AEC family transporter [Leptospiraceae bacterium]|nr:AEC family transporter [Leptospiraceae bacterium]